MHLATWWAGDPVPPLRLPPHFYARAVDDDVLMASLSHCLAQDARHRGAEGHRPYVGYLHRTPVVWTWLATVMGAFRERDVTFTLARGDRYLWDFAATPGGQKPHVVACFLQAVLAQEWPEAERFWIVQPAEPVWGAGVNLAGFITVGELSTSATGRVRLRPNTSHARATVGAALLGAVPGDY